MLERTHKYMYNIFGKLKKKKPVLMCFTPRLTDHLGIQKKCYSLITESLSVAISFNAEVLMVRPLKIKIIVYNSSYTLFLPVWQGCHLLSAFIHTLS